MFQIHSVLLLALLPTIMQALSNKTETICLSPRNNVTYSCEAHQMVHVISKLYQEASSDCKVVDDGCEIIEDNLNNGFTTQCNGEVSCSEYLSTFRLNKTCGNITVAWATVSYECVIGPAIDICSSNTVSSGTNHSLYLASPNYPELILDASRENSCECYITGTDMSIEILQIRFLFDIKIRANLTLNGDSSTWESHPNTFLAYNLQAISKVKSILHVIFDSYGRTNQQAWIRIKGTSDITAKCNEMQLTTPVPPHSSTMSTSTMGGPTGSPSLSVSSSPPPVDSPMHSNRTKTAESNTVALAVGCVFAILVVAAVVIVVIFVIIRRKRLKPYMRSHEDKGSMKHVEAYQLSLASREASDNKLSINGNGPLSPDYADVEPLRTIKTDDKFPNGTATSPEPLSSGYAEISQLGTTGSGSTDDHAPDHYGRQTPHYFVLERAVATKADVGHNGTSAVNNIQAGSEYAEPYTLNMTKLDAKQAIGWETAPGTSSPHKSSVPYTSKRLEELYAKIIPKKFRSTRDMRDAGEKQNAKNSKQKRKSDTSIHGITNDVYHDEDENTDDKHKLKSKDRRGRNESGPHYQEIGTELIFQRNDDNFPPVPPKPDGFREELGKKQNQKSNKNGEERPSSSDISKKSKSEVEKESQVQLENYSDKSTFGSFGKGATTSANDSDSDDKLVMVDNCLYEGFGREKSASNAEIAGIHRKSSGQLAQGSDYDDVKDDTLCSRPIVICDKLPEGPAQYEEVVV